VIDQRLPQLLDTVKAGALCASRAPGIPEADDWYRGDKEPVLEWRRRKQALKAVCAACPVWRECRESALRQGEGSTRHDQDMVRGGLAAKDLVAMRTAQSDRLEAAAEADRQSADEEHELQRLWRLLGTLTSGASDHGKANTSVNTRTRRTADQIQAIQSDRRARTRVA